MVSPHKIGNLAYQLYTSPYTFVDFITFIRLTIAFCCFNVCMTRRYLNLSRCNSHIDIQTGNTISVSKAFADIRKDYELLAQDYTALEKQKNK